MFGTPFYRPWRANAGRLATLATARGTELHRPTAQDRERHCVSPYHERSAVWGISTASGSDVVICPSCQKTSTPQT
jgi:hypothetical protein